MNTNCGCVPVLRKLLADTKEHLRAANKGAERNAKINQSFANKIISIERELDEARENLRILAGLVAYGLGQSGEEWSLEAMRQATTAIQKAKALEGEK